MAHTSTLIILET